MGNNTTKNRISMKQIAVVISINNWYDVECYY